MPTAIDNPSAESLPLYAEPSSPPARRPHRGAVGAVVQMVKRALPVRDEDTEPNATTRIWRSLRNLYHYHPRERFINFTKVQLRTKLGSWRRMSLAPSITNRIFYACTREVAGQKDVIKLPMGNDEVVCEFIRAVRVPETFARYQQTLDAVQADPWLKEHCVAVKAIARDGGYTSEYIEGFNLAEVRDGLLTSGGIPQSLRSQLALAINRLVENLTGYRKAHGQVIGDWFLHNLIFSPERNAIINIDAEGFFTWHGETAPSSLPLLTSVFRDLVTVLRLLDSSSPECVKVIHALRVMEEVRLSGERYSGHYFIVGYHSLNLGGIEFRGQRNCAERLAQVPFDFKGKVVMDLGCNCGGMLHALSSEIRRGYGFDYNPKCVNAANAAKELNGESNLAFFAFDFDRDDLSLLRPLMGGERPDICFLLSVCMWLRKWRELVHEASALADTLLFESNGTPEQQREQVHLLHRCYDDVSLVAESSLDDFLQGARRLYFCTRKSKTA